jgi:hypothetical protein
MCYEMLIILSPRGRSGLESNQFRARWIYRSLNDVMCPAGTRVLRAKAIL